LIHPINPATVIATKTGEANMETDIQELARKYSSAAIAVLAELMCDEEAPASVRLAAAKTLLERGWGRVTAGKGEERPSPPADRQSGARERSAGQDASPIPQSTPTTFASEPRESRPEPKRSPHDPEPRRRNRTGKAGGAENRPRPEAWAG
jgi:hypothetical protein